MAFNLKRLIPIYQANIDNLIDQLGKDIEIHFKPTTTNITPEARDRVRNTSKFPDFKAQAPTLIQYTKIIKALVKWNVLNKSRDLEHFGLRVDHNRHIVRLKSFLTDVPDLKRAEFIIPNVAVEQLIGIRFKLLRDPLPIGLGVDRYAVSFWEAI